MSLRWEPAAPCWVSVLLRILSVLPGIALPSVLAMVVLSVLGVLAVVVLAAVGVLAEVVLSEPGVLAEVVLAAPGVVVVTVLFGLVWPDIVPVELPVVSVRGTVLSLRLAERSGCEQATPPVITSPAAATVKRE